MSAQKFQVKLYLADGNDLDLEAIIPVFHGYIRDQKIPQMLIDVADYGHVEDGPGVVLIGYGTDYYVETREGRTGLLFSRKRGFEGDSEAALLDAVKSALHVASLLEAEPGLGARFVLGDVLVRLNDRLAAKNDDASFAAYGELARKVVGEALGAELSAAREGEGRDLLTIRLRGGRGTVGEALARVA